MSNTWRNFTIRPSFPTKGICLFRNRLLYRSDLVFLWLARPLFLSMRSQQAGTKKTRAASFLSPVKGACREQIRNIWRGGFIGYQSLLTYYLSLCLWLWAYAGYASCAQTAFGWEFLDSFWTPCATMYCCSARCFGWLLRPDRYCSHADVSGQSRATEMFSILIMLPMMTFIINIMWLEKRKRAYPSFWN